jgi:hypothetical protein
LIMLFNFDRDDDFLLFHTFWTKIAFVEIDDVSSFANIQNSENGFILQKSVNYCFFMIDFKSYDWQKFCSNFMKMILLLSVSKSSFRECFKTMSSCHVMWLLIILKIAKVVY